MYGVTWPQIRNLLQMILTATGGYAAGKWPSLDWPMISGIVMSVAGLVWTVRTGQKDVMISDTAALSEVRKVELEPRAAASHDLAEATPENVQVSKDTRQV